MHDLIGDIHGHADALQKLLKTLGYSRQKGVYKHPERQVVFLGDFSTAGPRFGKRWKSSARWLTRGRPCWSWATQLPRL